MKLLTFLIGPVILTTLFIIDPTYARFVLHGALMTLLPTLNLAIKDVTYEEVEPYLDAWADFKNSIWYNDIMNILMFIRHPSFIELFCYIDTMHDIIAPIWNYDDLWRTEDYIRATYIPEVAGTYYVYTEFFIPLLDIIFLKILL